MSLKIFISYAKEDLTYANDCFEKMARAGFDPWLDEKKLLPGHNWMLEIDKAFKGSHVILMLLSERSVNKRGFVQREANDALEELRYKKKDDIYIIPLRIEPCEIPLHLASRFQYLDLNSKDAWEKIFESLRTAASQQSIQLEQNEIKGPFTIYTERYEDKWEGLPGHDISIEYPKIMSEKNIKVASQLSMLFAGRTISTLINSYQKPWDQSPEFHEDKGAFTSTNGRWDSFDIVHATEKIFSLKYKVSWYGAGAAHPNSHFETYNYLLENRIYPLKLSDFFTDMRAAMKIINKCCIDQLSKEYFNRTGEKPDAEQLNWFEKGSGADENNYSAFNIQADGLMFIFPPYQVAAYALGSWHVAVSYYELLDLLRPDGPYKSFATN